MSVLETILYGAIAGVLANLLTPRTRQILTRVFAKTAVGARIFGEKMIQVRIGQIESDLQRVERLNTNFRDLSFHFFRNILFQMIILWIFMICVALMAIGAATEPPLPEGIFTQFPMIIVWGLAAFGAANHVIMVFLIFRDVECLADFDAFKKKSEAQIQRHKAMLKPDQS